MTTKLWNEIVHGIHFERTDIVLKWNIAMEALLDIGNPIIAEVDGRMVIKWKNRSLLNGIVGTWMTTYFPHENLRPFKSIDLIYSGDKISLDEYQKMKSHLLIELGNPAKEKESEEEKEAKWENGDCFIHLYLFEMHTYRCSLTIGVN